MGFIEGLSKVKIVILIVIDHFFKYAHIIPLSHPHTAVSVAYIFFSHTVRLHGAPESIVCDQMLFLQAFSGRSYVS